MPFIDTAIPKFGVFGTSDGMILIRKVTCSCRGFIAGTKHMCHYIGKASMRAISLQREARG